MEQAETTITRPVSAAAPPPWLTLRRALLIVAAVAIALRLVTLGSIPLIITNDGALYIRWAMQLLEGRPLDMPPYRTPGYPAILAACFAALGAGPSAVLIAHRLMGLAAALIACWAAARLAGTHPGTKLSPRFGLVAGLMVALDPVLLGYESYALTEAPSTFLLLAASAVALVGPRRWPGLVLLGTLLAALCFLRPAFQVAVPFLILAHALRTDAPWPRLVPRVLARAAVAAAALLLVASPWLAIQARRGVHGFAASGGAVLWFGVTHAGLLDHAAVPPDMRPAYDRHLAQGVPTDAQLHMFAADVNAWDDPAASKALSSWATRSILARPAAYARAAAIAALWQLDTYPALSPWTFNETQWFMRRAAGPLPDHAPDAPANILGPRPGPALAPFAMADPRGPADRLFLAWAGFNHPGAIRWPLAIAAAVAAITLLRARRWPILLVLLASLAYWAVHAVMLMPPSRYALPAWQVWTLAPAMIAAALHARRRAAP